MQGDGEGGEAEEVSMAGAAEGDTEATEGGFGSQWAGWSAWP